MANSLRLRIWLPLLMMIMACGAWTSSVLADATLTKNGKPAAAVVLPAEPTERESNAAEEIVNHIKAISGAELQVVTGGKAPAGMTPIYIGNAADASLDKGLKEAKATESSFTLKVTDDAVHIRGVGDQGALNGSFELLEQLGVRWYLPGDYGTVIPEAKTVTLKNQTTTQVPSFVYRKLQHLGDELPWIRRARLGGESRSTGQHGIPGLDKKYFKEHPEYFSLNSRGVRSTRQDCLSNPDVVKLATEAMRKIAQERVDAGHTGNIYIGASSHDGGGYCECENCQALDQGVYDPTADRISMTDRYNWFFIQILNNLEEEFPQLHIVTYTYGAHMMPPAGDTHPRIVPVFAPITIDRVHSMDNPMAPDRHLLRWLIDEWSAKGAKEMYFRGYYHNLACVQLPFSQIDRIRDETPAFHEKGVTAMRVENIHTAWSSAFLDLYLATRLMWDVDTDVDALLDEFYTLYYGPAEKEMRAYHEGLNSAFDDTPYFTGSSYLYFPIFLNQPRTAELRGHLDAAKKAAAKSDNEKFAKRIAAVRLGWDRMEYFLGIIDARNNFDFKKAKEIEAKYIDISNEGMNHILEGEGTRGYKQARLIFTRSAGPNGGTYYRRFFEKPISSGYERAVEKGEIVATLDDEWLFLQDPPEIGEINGYHRPGELGGNWSPIKTSTRSWSDQGMHYYKGVAWYRQKVFIPKEWEGRKIYLWFGAVDELAKVWINGKYVGTNREPEEGLPGIPGTFRPFDLPATDQIKYGEDNWVVAELTNKGLSELGTGGIVAPVMFWSPTGDWYPGKKEEAEKKKK